MTKRRTTLKQSAIFLIITTLIWGANVTRANAQDVDYARFVVKNLASPEMKGRGYVDKGDLKAARFIAKEFKKHGVKPLVPGYFQKYTFSINSFPGKMLIVADGSPLRPGEDYLVAKSSRTTAAPFLLRWLLNDSLANSADAKALQDKDLSQVLVVTDKYHRKLSDTNYLGAAGYIFLRDSARYLTWRASDGKQTKDYLLLDIKEGAITPATKSLYIEFENKFHEVYETQNVVGIIPGRACPDSMFVITAHYDHLGMMGNNTVFPGANDNASGVAVMLDLARQYSIPGFEPYYTMVFVATSGEEVGLMGANHCAENMPFDASKVKFLINLDMVGTGSDGISLVNGEIFENAAALMERINAEKKYLPNIRRRGESCNSDHCPFYRKGIPSFFIYTMGKEWRHYHDTGDTADGPPFTGYNGLFDLLKDFFNQYGRK